MNAQARKHRATLTAIAVASVLAAPGCGFAVKHPAITAGIAAEPQRDCSDQAERQASTAADRRALGIVDSVGLADAEADQAADRTGGHRWMIDRKRAARLRQRRQQHRER